MRYSGLSSFLLRFGEVKARLECGSVSKRVYGGEMGWVREA
jgi:hypothetical protein